MLLATCMLTTEPVRLLFLCLARDCEATINKFFSYLDRLNAEGFVCTVLIGENGSQDQTRAMILGAVSKNVHLVDTGIMSVQKGRLTRMAVGRQLLLETSRNMATQMDYVCVADLDNAMERPPDPSSVRSSVRSLQEDPGLFGAGATSTPFYYDLLSLKSDTYYNPRLPQELAEAKRRPLSYYRYHEDSIYARQREVTSPNPVFCESSFNGFCIYPVSSYYVGTYRCSEENNVCEHLTFNLSISLKTGKRMVIVPELTINAPRDHAPVSFGRFWMDRLKKIVTRFLR